MRFRSSPLKIQLHGISKRTRDFFAKRELLAPVLQRAIMFRRWFSLIEAVFVDTDCLYYIAAQVRQILCRGIIWTLKKLIIPHIYC
jgi:hypothetical protein